MAYTRTAILLRYIAAGDAKRFVFTPFEPGERVQGNPGKSGGCLSEASSAAARIFQASERTL
ncbi:MAG: hypothetical protein ACLQDF_06975 [Desulfomonilia bacterium]